MRQAILYCLAILLFAGCKKEQGSRVNIYLLKSFTSAVDTTTKPVTVAITNPVLDDTPLVADEDIRFYTRGTNTFTLRKDIKTVIQHYGPDKAFAVTVDNQPVYLGKFHPLYLSSMTFGVATIAPEINNNKELKIDFITIEGNSFLQQLDKRNDSRIINTLKASNRLR
ncbi:hypothetical protein EXU57_17050 [Segetibacter sp. 3557_3]|uniref:hypothetical protein n=1 Tax=Segetibacter sp. 3557_3 TaxID=2547429 RepID=UPI001058E025|nr:hypothetical protein [Segetibacter sp. 3557_3]TDH23509.1 hypothetical protein EXU57_17050 [Segetibacter sp. 3557_3]